MKKLGKQLSAENSEESSNSKAVFEDFFYSFIAGNVLRRKCNI